MFGVLRRLLLLEEIWYIPKRSNFRRNKCLREFDFW